MSSSSANCAARASVSPFDVDDDAVTVEDQLILPAHQVAQCECRTGFLGPLGHHPLARDALAAVVGRGGGVDDELRARLGLQARGRTGVPDVLADREPDGRRR